MDGQPVAVYWKNGQPIALTSGRSEANGIFVFNGDVYVAGRELVDGIFRATLWKNGRPQRLGTAGDNAYSVYVEW
jgi:hypothetical protein